MRKIYEIPTLRLLMFQEDVITSSDTVHFEDEEALGKNDRIWSGF